MFACRALQSYVPRAAPQPQYQPQYQPQHQPQHQPQPQPHQPQQQPQPQAAAQTSDKEKAEEVKLPTFQAAPLHYVSIGAKLEGDYKFGYDTGKGSDKTGSFREESRLPDGTVKGSYGFIDASGRQRIIKYTAGKDGFKAEGDIYQEGAPKDTIPEHIQQTVSASPSAPAPSAPAPAPAPAPALATANPAAQYKPPSNSGPPAGPPLQFRPPSYSEAPANAAPQFKPPAYPQFRPAPPSQLSGPSQVPVLSLVPNFSTENLAFPTFFKHLAEQRPAATSQPAPSFQGPPSPAKQPPVFGYAPYAPPSVQARAAPYVPQFASKSVPQQAARPFGGLQLPAATSQQPSYPSFAQQQGYPLPLIRPGTYPPATAARPGAPFAVAPTSAAPAKQFVPAQYLQQQQAQPKVSIANLFAQEAQRAATKPNFADFLKQFVPRPAPQQQHSPAGAPATVGAPTQRPGFSPYGPPASAGPAVQRPPVFLQQAAQLRAPSYSVQAGGQVPLYNSFRPPAQQAPSFAPRPAAVPQIPTYPIQRAGFYPQQAPAGIAGSATQTVKKDDEDIEDGSYNPDLYDHGLYDPKKYEEPYLKKKKQAASTSAPAGGFAGLPPQQVYQPAGQGAAQQGQVEEKALPLFDHSLLAYNIGTG
ncbi:hypothetical protein V5799_006641 [Amblyomma americanum]|uniref:Uncharacterized protein n=1 Tax=Amblyomma americanum TaxID=6943 RepID=A0AAQ4DVT8_AMBAM